MSWLYKGVAVAEAKRKLLVSTNEDMTRYLIHIGPHKTGSTYLQGAFRSMRAVLLGRGVLYPDLWQGEDKLSHQKLPQKLRAGANDELIGEFGFLNGSSIETILISSEDLVDLSEENILTLKSLLGRSSARVIFYCRRWSELLPSGWQELVKHGDTITFPEFFSAHVVNAFGSNMINYGRALDRYAQHFGLENISLVSYSNIMDGNGDLFVHFCQNFLSWTDPPVPALGRVNVSLNPVEVEIIRSFNAIHQGEGGQKSAAILRSYQLNKGSLDLSAVISAMRAYIGYARMNEGLGSLKHLHGELFRRFGSLLVGPRFGQGLFAPKLGEAPYVRRDYLLADGVVASIQSAYRKIRSGNN